MLQSIEQIESEFRAKRPVYEAFASRLKSLIVDILTYNQISFHIVEARAKTESSFSEKIRRHGKSYSDPINQVKDLCGCRIILYYIDDVQLVRDIIESEFDVIEIESMHQSHELDADRFGYLSLHMIVKLKADRYKLREWGVFSELCVEIQIRTVIQHAWSAVSHAMQYKQETSVPSKLRRRLFRIAGLFELADEEFLAIRKEKQEHEKTTELLIESDISSVPISLVSIEKSLEKWTQFIEVEKDAARSGFMKGDEDSEISFALDIHDLCIRSDIKSSGDLLNILNSKYKDTLFPSLSKMYPSHAIASREFVAFCIFSSLHPQSLHKEDMKKNGWDDKVADEFMGIIRSI